MILVPIECVKLHLSLNHQLVAQPLGGQYHGAHAVQQQILRRTVGIQHHIIYKGKSLFRYCGQQIKLQLPTALSDRRFLLYAAGNTPLDGTIAGHSDLRHDLDV